LNLLLDTCTFLWIVAGSSELSRKAKQSFQDPGNRAYLSSVSVWEIALKHSLRRLKLSGPPAEFVPAQRKLHGVDPLFLDEEAALHLAKLPRLHRDPFDRMLVCQAVTASMTLVTPDPEIHRYAVRTLW